MLRTAHSGSAATPRFFAAVFRATSPSSCHVTPAPSLSPSRPGRRFSSSPPRPAGETAASPMAVASSPVNPLQMNQYVFACTATNKAAIVDCGAPTKSEFDPFVGWLESGGGGGTTTQGGGAAPPYELEAVLQTHAHLDHVAGLGLARETFPAVPIYLHERERGLYEGFDEARRRWDLPSPDVPLPSPDDITYFDDDVDSISVGELTLEIIPTAGHSPGHVGFYEPQSNTFFGGDVIMRGSVGRTDFPTSDPGEMKKSLRRILERLNDDTTIYSGHGMVTTMGEERRNNPFLKGL